MKDLGVSLEVDLLILVQIIPVKDGAYTSRNRVEFITFGARV
jgi:hypothetical protein